MRRLLLVNALIFAVLAAAVALAYYSFSYSTGSRERELELMKDLAEEKVLNIESLIDETDTKLFKEIQPAQLANLADLVKTTGAAVTSVFVLDDHLQMVPSGSYSTRDLLFRDWLCDSADDRERYETVKRELAARSWDDSNDYADAKNDVIAEIMERAQLWASQMGWSFR